ncbi:abortive infection system antitoxin AbiGi family protein [Nonomuraea fuscirosea]|uniref:abortive infection system antitoxin AbiGi family protein n=1 Tax=Nonomuraea fuscirosea TaxID=1291556 RepID=UPI0015E7BA5D|nr:abortive infection system antitoxin AbiGi family protein [Nonomuraea fuscirosea]
MALGFRGNNHWRDMSEYLVHITQRQSFFRIIEDGMLLAVRPFGAARNIKGLGDSQRSVCMSEIPLDYLYRLIGRRGEYGIGFKKHVVTRSGGAPVWYLRKEGAVANNFRKLVERATRERTAIDPNDPIWLATPYVDYPGDYGDRRYEFEWEREWRVSGGVPLEVAPGLVSFLFAPEADHARLAQSWADDGLPALIDAKWPMGKIQRVLADSEL